MRTLTRALAAALLWPAGADGQDVFPPPREPLTIQALRVTEPVTVDGRLEEPDWQRAPAARNFRQVEPKQGEPASFDTEVRMLYDAENLYIGADCRDSGGPGGVRVRNLRRDFDFSVDDVFGVSFDTFRDGQNALVFETNPYGAHRDQQVRDSDSYDLQWDAVWRVRTHIGAEGWTAELAIPWSTLRYPAARGDWAVNFVRVIRRINETTGWSPWPRAYTPYRMSYAGLVSGLEPPPPSTNIRLQPYAVLQGERTSGQTPAEDVKTAVGGDLKWAITPNTVLDATFNTDFAQADVDRQVVNLTRFSVFFPEQRPFFQENASLFSAGQEREVRPFFSRRIGLDEDGRPIPIEGGVRVTHRSRKRSAGGLLIRQEGSGSSQASTFAVGRFIQNVGRESRVGGLLVSRFDESASADEPVTNTVATLDSFLRLKPTLYFRGMLSGSLTSGAPGDGWAGSIDLTREGNRGGIWWTQEYVGPGYKASAGFLTRPDLIRTSPGFKLDVRPSWRPPFVRRFVWHTVANIYHRASDRRFQEAQWFVPLLGVWFENSGWFLSFLLPTWQSLDHPFSPLPGLRIEPGHYQFNRFAFSSSTDTSRRFVLRLDGELGPFYDGHSQSFYISGHASPTPRVALSAAYSLNVLRDIGRERTDRTTHLVAPVIRLALNPSLQLTTSYQYNTAARLSTWNARFSWEFRPLSYLYLVYNERDPMGSAREPSSPMLPLEQQLILKLTFNKQL